MPQLSPLPPPHPYLGSKIPSVFWGLSSALIALKIANRLSHWQIRGKFSQGFLSD